MYLLPYYFQEVQAKLNGENVNWAALHGLLCLHLFSYLFWVIVLLMRHVEHVKHLFSSIQQVDLAWLRSLTIAFGVIWLLTVGIFITGDYDGPINYASPLLLSLIVYAIGYRGFR